MPPFIGRKKELDLLSQLLQKKTASLVVIKGRRRIGKSRLIHEFGKSLKSYFFTGLPPEKGITAEKQKEEFARKLREQLHVPSPKPDDWADLFQHLAVHTQKGTTLIVFDEINWMGSLDPTFLGKLKTAWDESFKNNSSLICILCGSISTWIDKNILSSTGFFGRISLNLTIEELSLSECNLFWRTKQDRISAYEKCKLLSITGGVPRYLEEILPDLSADENIRRLCFQPEGLLFEEYENIFSDLFSKKNTLYKKIVHKLAEKPAEQGTLLKALDIQKGGDISKYLNDLIMAGFVSRDFTWNIQSGNDSKLSLYRLRDNYLKFYVKYIEPNKAKIKRGSFFCPFGWESTLGLQFENLILSNRKALWSLLHISPQDIECENPYFQHKTNQRDGCQIDYMIQTRHALYVCEIKFKMDPIGIDVIEETQEKIKRLKAPKHFSFYPVLIHINGVKSSVIEKDFFSHIIDFGKLLTLKY